MSKFASFLTGMGGGYIKAQDKQYERERQAKDDAWREEQQGWQRADRAEKDALRTSMKDAFADRSTIEGTAVTGTTGTNLYKDPAQAQAAADEARIEAEMRGESPSAVATMQATGITGNMSKGHQITTAPVDLASLNSRDAKMARGVNALMAAGDPEKAISMENTVMENQAKKLGLNVAQLKFADETTRRQMSNALASGATWHEGAAKFVTQSQYPTIKDVKGESVVSPDGKTVTLFAVMPDGTRKTAGTYPSDETGSIKFMEQFGSLPIETRIGLMQGRATAATDQANKDRDFTLREREVKLRQDALLMRGAGAGSSSGRGAGTGASQPGGLNMSDVDKQLAPMFTSDDPVTGQKKLNTGAYAFVRSLATQMPAAAQGDAVGAALQAAQQYESVLSRVGGDHAKAARVIEAAMRPVDVGSPAAAQPEPEAQKPQAQSTQPSKPKTPRIDPALELQILGHKMRTTGVSTMADMRRAEELQAEIAAKRGKEWWRGRASDADFGN